VPSDGPRNVSRLVSVIALILGLAAGALVATLGTLLWARGALGARDAEIGRQSAMLDASREKLELVERTQGQWEEQLKALTHDALSSSSSTLLELAAAKLQPISETLERFELQARALEQKRLTAVTTIDEVLRNMSQGQERLRKETGNLVTALRAPHVRGRWGEMQLKRVVELAGMLAYCDFVEQESSRDDEGRLLRPDLVVKLPGGKSIVVDSKAPLDAYLDAAEAEDDAVRRTHLDRHARLVRDHMTKLGQKRYWQQFEHSPEYVVMFLGDEGFYRAALDQDPSLLEAGAEAGVIRVIPASPTTLIALLRSASYGWQQETVAESARSIAKLGREVYERLGTYSKHFAKVGRSLDAAVGSYNEAVGSFETRVLVTARKFPEYGAGGDELPEVTPIERQTRPFVAAELTAGEPVVELPQRAVDAA
jgi:DNA recombination protein RmuC